MRHPWCGSHRDTIAEVRLPFRCCAGLLLLTRLSSRRSDTPCLQLDAGSCRKQAHCVRREESETGLADVPSRDKKRERLPIGVSGTLSPVPFEGESCRIAAISSGLHSNAAGILCDSDLHGGGRGIRTPGTLSGTAGFKTACFNHSHIPPRLCCQQFSRFLLARMLLIAQV